MSESKMTQDEYIAILFLDCGYDTTAKRRGWMRLRYGKSYADELNASQKHKVIEELKGEKELGV